MDNEIIRHSLAQDSSHPKAIANQVKHPAFTRCDELNLSEMFDAQVAAVKSELLSRDSN
jgi:hypothetical protein